MHLHRGLISFITPILLPSPTLSLKLTGMASEQHGAIHLGQAHYASAVKNAGAMTGNIAGDHNRVVGRLKIHRLPKMPEKMLIDLIRCGT
jgi:hypothetical protein